MLACVILHSYFSLCFNERYRKIQSWYSHKAKWILWVSILNFLSPPPISMGLSKKQTAAETVWKRSDDKWCIWHISCEVQDSKYNQQTCKSQHQILDKYLYACIQKHILHSWQPGNTLVFKCLGFWSLNHHMGPFQAACLPRVVLLGEILLFMCSWTCRAYFCNNFVSWAASVGSSLLLRMCEQHSNEYWPENKHAVSWKSVRLLHLLFLCTETKPSKMFCTKKVQKSR